MRTFLKPATSVFLHLKAVLDSVDHAFLWHCVSLKGVTLKLISFIRSLDTTSRSPVRAYGDFSLEFTRRFAIQQSYPISSLLFTFFGGWLWRLPPPHVRILGMIFAHTGTCDLEYTVPSKGPNTLKIVLHCLNKTVGIFGMGFGPS